MSAGHHELREAIDQTCRHVLERGTHQAGEEVSALERELADRLGISDCVPTGSCSDAMHRALVGLGIGPGHDVITPANTDIACTAAIHRAGARTVFRDIEEDTFSMDPVDAADHDLAVIEDAAIALGSRHRGSHAGTFGNAGCFSFDPSKQPANAGDRAHRSRPTPRSPPAFETCTSTSRRRPPSGRSTISPFLGRSVRFARAPTIGW